MCSINQSLIEFHKKNGKVKNKIYFKKKNLKNYKIFFEKDESHKAGIIQLKYHFILFYFSCEILKCLLYFISLGASICELKFRFRK